MKRYIEFGHHGLADNGEIFPCCGTDSVIKFDNRLSNSTVKYMIANRTFTIHPHATHYRFMRGESISTMKPCTNYIKL